MKRAAAIGLTAASVMMGCQTGPTNPTDPGGDQPEPVQFSKTVTEFSGARQVYENRHSFDIDFGARFNPASVREIRVTIDTDGLSYDQYACDHGVPDSCDDDLEFNDVERWNRASGAGRSNTKAGTVDTGEQRRYTAELDEANFAKATAAIEDGKIRVTVHPTSRDNYSVHSVSLFVIHVPDSR